MTTIQEEKFIEFVVTNRMELCYSRWEKAKKTRKGKKYEELEKAYETALSTLSEQNRDAIEKYFATMFEDSCEETNFFYRTGIKDGYNLYRRIKEIEQEDDETFPL